MGRLIYGMIASLDGYTEDEGGDFGWAEPDAETHAHANELERSIGTHLYGRRMYETMAVWETDPSLAAGSDHTRDYAEIWQSGEKIVYSRTLEAPITSNTRLEREFDPAAVRSMKGSSERDLNIGGPELAAHGFRAGLIDEVHLFIAPVIVGGGKPALPAGVRFDLDLVDQRRFDGGMVYLRYAVAGERAG